MKFFLFLTLLAVKVLLPLQVLADTSSNSAIAESFKIDPSEKIVDDLAELGKRMRPGQKLFLQRLPAWAKERYLLYPNWQWIALVLLVLLTHMFKVLLHFVLGTVEKIAGKSKAQWDDQVVHALRTPLAFSGAAVFWYAGIQLIGFTGTSLTFFTVVTKMVLGLSVVGAVYNFTDLAIQYVQFAFARAGKGIEENLLQLLHRMLKLFVLVLGFLFFFQNLGINVMSVLAGLGLGGLAFALAAKDTCANFFGSIMILLDQPFKVGDWIKVGDDEGTVEEIGFRSTRIRTFYNSLVSLPNSNVANLTIDNLGRREFRRIRTFLGVTYDTPPKKMEAFVEGIKEIIRQNPATRKDLYHVVFNGYKDSSLEVMIYCFLVVPDWAEELKQREQIFLEIYRLAEKLGVSFAFPTQTLHVGSLPEIPRHLPS